MLAIADTLHSVCQSFLVLFVARCVETELAPLVPIPLRYLVEGQPGPFPDAHLHAVAPHVRLGELVAQNLHLSPVLPHSVAVLKLDLVLLLQALAYVLQLLLFQTF